MRQASDLRRTRAIIALVSASAAISPCSAQTKPPADLQSKAVQVEMKNIMYHFTPQIVVHIVQLNGTLVPSQADRVPIFDDVHSFRLAIESAQISITTAAMANVLNQYVFARKDAPLKELSLRAEGTSLKIKGKLHNKGDISFEVESTIDATQEGQIRLHAKKIRAAHLPAKGFMDLFGIELSDLINTRKVAGVRTEGDDLILNPEEILPPPHIQGHVTQVRIQGDRIIQTFGNRAPRVTGTGNYMAYRGNQLRFGKLEMTNTDMVLIDLDPQDPFDFYLEHYNEQLVAGYVKVTLGFGLRVFMRDFNKIQKSPSKAAVAH